MARFIEREHSTKSESKQDQRRREYDNLVAFVKSGSTEFSHLTAAVSQRAGEASACRQAEAIIDAGDIARAGGPAFPAPTGTAAAIIAAGRKARGEV